jgi:phosphatidylglycerol:prolipoprotein diacylglycerol transferase
MEATLSVPFFHLGSWDIGIPIQAFGVIVAAGVLIGAALLRRYAEWHGVSDEHIRGITGWITVTGFLGAHWFNALFYEFDRLMKEPILFLKLWDGISSYGGFVGGAMGFALYVWWKRLPARLFADIAIVGLLPAFSIGRIGCTVVSDHVGGFVDKTQWYAALAMNYPRDVAEYTNGKYVAAEIPEQIALHPATDGDRYITLWNLGFVELLYLIPVNLFLLWYAFRPKKRPNAGMIAVLSGLLYAPVRFFMDYLRPEGSDPRHLGFTFAQWCSLIAFGVAVYVAYRIMKTGKAAETVTTTSGEAQARLKVLLKEEDEKADKEKSKAKVTPSKKRPPTDDDDEDDDKPAAKKPDEKKKEAEPAGKKKLAPAEVAPTEPSMEALPKDIVEKASKSADKKATDKKPDDKKPDEKKEDKKPPAIVEKPADEGAEVDPKEIKKAADSPGDKKADEK